MDSIAALVTAASTLTGVGLTLYFTNRREKGKFHQDLKYKDLLDTEKFYVELIATIDKQVHRIKIGEFEPAKSESEMLLVAKVSLYAPNHVVEKFRDVQNCIQKWALVHAKATPRRIGDSGYSMITSSNLEYTDQSREAYQVYFDKAVEFVEMVKGEIDKKRNELQ